MMIAGFALLCWGALKTNNVAVLYIGNGLSFLSSYIAGKLYKKVCRDYLNIREKPSLSGKFCGRLDGSPVIRCCGVSIDTDGNIWLDIGNLWICARFGKETYIK